MKSRNPLPSGQNWLINRLGELIDTSLTAPPMNDKGICFGVAYMAAQAIWTGDFDTFCQRLHAIYTIPTEKFRESFQQWKQARIDSIAKVKRAAIETLEKLDPTQKTQFVSEPIIKNKLDALARSTWPA